MTWIVSLISLAVGMAETAISFKTCFMSYMVETHMSDHFHFMCKAPMLAHRTGGGLDCRLNLKTATRYLRPRLNTFNQNSLPSFVVAQA